MGRLSWRRGWLRSWGLFVGVWVITQPTCSEPQCSCIHAEDGVGACPHWMLDQYLPSLFLFTPTLSCCTRYSFCSASIFFGRSWGELLCRQCVFLKYTDTPQNWVQHPVNPFHVRMPLLPVFFVAHHRFNREFSKWSNLTALTFVSLRIY